MTNVETFMKDFDFRSREYAEAQAKYEEAGRELRNQPDHWGWLGAHAEAAFRLGRLDEALYEYRRANALDRVPGEPPGASQTYLKHIGTILWLLGRREEAIATFRTAVDGVVNGSIRFADPAGGVSQGLLLWYAGVTACDDDARYQAGHYLWDRLNHRECWSWPGPIAAYVMGKAQQEVLLAAPCGASEIDAAMERAKHDLRRCRQVVQALFYMAVQSRSECSEERCGELMVKCASLENPVVEHEWYVARAEVESLTRR